MTTEQHVSDLQEALAALRLAMGQIVTYEAALQQIAQYDPGLRRADDGDLNIVQGIAKDALKGRVKAPSLRSGAMSAPRKDG